MEKKPCTKCGEVKSLDEFYNRKNVNDGKYSFCKVCDNKRTREYRHKYPEKHLWWAARYRAKKYGIPFDLTIEDIVIPEVCPVFKKPFVFSIGRKHGLSPSLDRIVPSKGYIKGNIIVVSWRVNAIKNDATIKELEVITNFYKNLINSRIIWVLGCY